MRAITKLRKYLTENGQSQRWFCTKHLGIKEKYFSMMMKGHRPLPPCYWEKIVKATNEYVEMKDFLEG